MIENNSTLNHLEDEKNIIDEINSLVDRERKQISQSEITYNPRSSGQTFPFILNIAILIITVLSAVAMTAAFNSMQNQYVLKEVTETVKGSDIISALRDEAKNVLALKEKEIELYRSELNSIDGQLTALGIDDVIERNELQVKKENIQKNLEQALKEKDALLKQVQYQTESLKNISTDTENTPKNSLQDLMDKQQLTNIYYANIKGAAETISLYVNASAWSHAKSEISKIRNFISDFISVQPNLINIKDIKTQSYMLNDLSLLINAAEEGWPEIEEETIDESPYLLEIERLKTENSDMEDRIYNLNDEIGNNEGQWEAIANDLDRLISGKPKNLYIKNSAIPENLQIRLARLEESLDSGKSLLKEREVLRKELQSENDSRLELEAALLAENVNKQDLRNALEKSSSEFSDMNLTLAELNENRNKWGNFSSDLNKTITGMKNEEQSFDTIMSFFEESPAVNENFPDLPIILKTSIANLVQTEITRARKEAEDKMLARLIAQTDKVEAEQAVYLTATDNKDDDSMALLDSLIKELDKMKAETLENRENAAVTQAMGAIISVNKPHVTVRKASRPDLFNIKRIFISRMLESGDRVPIADAKIKAMSSNNLLLEITDTIVPEIFPEINDIVYIEH